MFGGIKDPRVARFVGSMSAMPVSLGIFIFFTLQYTREQPPSNLALAGSIIGGLATLGCIYDAVSFVVSQAKGTTTDTTEKPKLKETEVKPATATPKP